MFYVYFIKSLSFPGKTYIGFTANLKERLAAHNAGKSLYIKDFKPWTLIGFLGFDQETKALKFERHLKTNVGRVFLRRTSVTRRISKSLIQLRCCFRRKALLVAVSRIKIN